MGWEHKCTSPSPLLLSTTCLCPAPQRNLGFTLFLKSLPKETLI
jgi:hypothetical protein